MVHVMQRPDRLLAEDAFLSFVPLIDDVPDQAVGGVGFDLPQAFLTAILALGPAGTFFEAQCRLVDKNPNRNFTRGDIHSRSVVCLGTGHQALSAKIEVGTNGGKSTREEEAGTNDQNRNGDGENGNCHRSPPGQNASWRG